MKRLTIINSKLSVQKSTLYSSQFIFNKETFDIFSGIADKYVKYILGLRDCYEGHTVDNIENNRDLFLESTEGYLINKTKIIKKITIY